MHNVPASCGRPVYREKEVKKEEKDAVPVLDMTLVKMADNYSFASKRSEDATTSDSIMDSYLTSSCASSADTDNDETDSPCSGNEQTYMHHLHVPRRDAVQESPRNIEQRRQYSSRNAVKADQIRVIPALQFSNDNLSMNLSAKKSSHKSQRPEPQETAAQEMVVRRQADQEIEKAIARHNEQRRQKLAAVATARKEPTPRPVRQLTDSELELEMLGYEEPRFEESEYVATPNEAPLPTRRSLPTQLGLLLGGFRARV